MGNNTITAVPGVAVGHWTDPVAATGVTVLTFPEPNRAVVDVRGGAPGTREIGTFGPAIKEVTVNALVFSGGSAFGLSAADGVMAEIEREGRGAPTPAGPVPIVPAAIVFDLLVGDAAVRPGPTEGAAAYRSRSEAPVPLGSVGAGTGAAVAAWRGPTAARKGGIGSAVVEIGAARVGALVVLNAAGDVFTLEGDSLTGGDHAPLEPSIGPALAENTTLVCIATDARIPDPNELRRAAIRGHDGLGACIRPTHSRYDGDSVFVASWDSHEADVDLVHQASFAVVGRAIEVAMRSATSVAGVPAIGET